MFTRALQLLTNSIKLLTFGFIYTQVTNGTRKSVCMISFILPLHHSWHHPSQFVFSEGGLQHHTHRCLFLLLQILEYALCTNMKTLLKIKHNPYVEILKKKIYRIIRPQQYFFRYQIRRWQKSVRNLKMPVNVHNMVLITYLSTMNNLKVKYFKSFEWRRLECGNIYIILCV